MQFTLNGQTYIIAKGSKLNLGFGTRYDGTFASIDKDEVISTKSENKDSKGRVSSTNETKSYTGQKLYLPNTYANTSVMVRSVIYRKKLGIYDITIIVKDGYYSLHLEEAIRLGEVIGIDGSSLNNQNIITSPKAIVNNSSNTPSTGTNYTLFLKNGSKIRCNLIEMKSNDYVKVETADKSIFVFKMNEVEELRDERLIDSNNPSVPDVPNPTTNLNSSIDINYFNVEKPAKESKGPIGNFYNFTQISAFLPNGTSKIDDKTVNTIGYGVKNISGFVFKDYLLLGGGIGFNGFYESNFPYYFVDFQFHERVFILPKKKVSPVFGMYQGFGTMLASISAHEGLVQNYGFEVGTAFPLAKSYNLGVSLSYNLQYLNYQYNAGGGYFYDETGYANYFGVNFDFGFKK